MLSYCQVLPPLARHAQLLSCPATQTAPGRALCNGHRRTLHPISTLSSQVLKCTSVRACCPSPDLPARSAPRPAAGADSQGKPHCVVSQQPCLRQSKALPSAPHNKSEAHKFCTPCTPQPMLHVFVASAHRRSRLNYQHSTQPYRSCQHAAPSPAVGADCKCMPRFFL